MKNRKGGIIDIEEFLNEHELKLGENEEFDIKPEAKFAVLGEALKNYYSTYKSGFVKGSKLSHFTIINGTIVNLNSANGHDYIVNCYNSMIQIQMFMEMYVVDVLESIHPILVKGKLNKEIDLLNAIVWQFDDIDYSKKKTIIFSQTLNRLEFLIEKFEDLPEQLKIDQRFHFLKSHVETMREVLRLRNKMLHRGRGILKDFALDFFWVNHIIPFVKDVLNIEERIPSLDKTTFSNLNVIEELYKIQLGHNYPDIENKELFISKLNRICHLKELGRASFNNGLFMDEWGNDAFKKNMLEEYNPKIKREENDKASLMLRSMNKYHNVYECPCCGCKTLLTFEPWTYHEDILKLHKAECTYCSYSITTHIGEPKDFGIMKDELFVHLY